MCWVNYKAQKLRASHDIPIIKICLEHTSTSIRSLFYNYIYELNKLYGGISIVPSLRRLDFIINEGYHSYSTDIEIKFLSTGEDDSIDIVIFYKGMYLSSFLYGSHPFVKAEGYIPEGTVFYINEQGEYVSEAIVITKYEELVP